MLNSRQMFSSGFCYCAGTDLIFSFYPEIISDEIYLRKMLRFRKNGYTENFMLILD